MTQLALFEPQIQRDARDIMWERARSSDVEMDVMAIFTANPTKWLDWNDFRSVIEKHKISSCFGHVLGLICRSGKTVEKNIYFGDEHPGMKNYLGFKSVYMLDQGAAA